MVLRHQSLETCGLGYIWYLMLPIYETINSNVLRAKVAPIVPTYMIKFTHI